MNFNFKLTMEVSLFIYKNLLGLRAKIQAIAVPLAPIPIFSLAVFNPILSFPAHSPSIKENWEHREIYSVTNSPFTVALSPTEVNAIAGEITVRIDGPKGGSGVIIEKQGNIYYVLTNWHVVDRVGDYEIQTSDGNKHSIYSSLIRQIPNLDLAIVPFSSSQRYRVAVIADSNAIAPGNTVYVAGWPRSGSSLGQRLFLSTKGTVTQRQQPRAGYSLVYNNLVRSGMSGGPILNEDGNLIGVNGIVQLATNPDQIVSAGIEINRFLEWRKTATLPTIPQPPSNAPTVRANPSPQSVSPVQNSRNVSGVNQNFALASNITEKSGEILGIDLYSTYGISGNSNGSVSVWNLENGGLRRTFQSHSAAVNSIAVSRDGKFLATASDDGTVKVWDLAVGLETGTFPLLHTLSGHSNAVLAVAISADGKTLASGSWDNSVKLWDIQTGELLQNLVGHSQLIRSVAFSPDSQILASGSKDNTVKLWNVETGQLIRTLDGHSLAVLSIAISSDGETLATGSADGTIALWKLKTGQPIRRLSGHSDGVWSVVISSDSQTLVSGSWDKTIKIWDIATGQIRTNLTGHSGYINAVGISSDGKTIMSGGWDSQVKIWKRS